MNLRDFGQPWSPTGEQSGVRTHIVGDGQRFVVREDEKLTAFLELESAIRSPNLNAEGKKLLSRR